MTNHKGYSKSGGAGGAGRVVSGGTVKICLGGKPLVYAHNAHYTILPAIEVQKLCKLLADLGIRSARKHAYVPLTLSVKMIGGGGGGGGSGQIIVSEHIVK